jgi:hypothetical protein
LSPILDEGLKVTGGVEKPDQFPFFVRPGLLKSASINLLEFTIGKRPGAEAGVSRVTIPFQSKQNRRRRVLCVVRDFVDKILMLALFEQDRRMLRYCRHSRIVAGSAGAER